MQSIPRRILAQLLSTLGTGELKVETARQILAESPNFEPSTALKRLDNPRLGSVTVSSLSNFFIDSGISATSREIQQLFSSLDLDQDLRVSLAEFQDFCLPRRDSVIKRRALSRDPYYLAVGDLLPRDAENSLVRLFEEELRLLRSTQALREDLVDSPAFNSSSLFNLLDDNGQGFLDFDSVEKFQRDNGYPLIEREIEAIFLRLDQDKDGKISYSEFSSGIRPISPSAGTFSPRRSSPRRSSPLRTSALERSIERQRMAESLRRSSPRRSPRRSPYDGPSRIQTASDRDYEEYLTKSYERSQILKRTSPSKIERDLAESTAQLSETVRTSPLRSPRRERVRSRSPVRSPRRSPSPMRVSDELEMVRSLKQMIDNNRDVEKGKNDLALRIDFNLLDAFRMFDLTERGSVTQRQFENGLNKLGVYASQNDVFLFFNRFNLKSDGYFSYSEFCDSVLPKAREYLRLMESRKAVANQDYDENTVFTVETRRLFKRVLTLLIENEVASEVLRKRMINRPFVTINDAFQALDREDKGYITSDEFQILLEDYGVFATQKDMEGIMDKYDKRQVGRVSYRDFLNESVPKSPQKH